MTGFAHQTGLRPGTPVIFGGSDTPLQALGQGVTAPGSVSCAISTGGQLLAPLTEPRCDPDLRTHTFCGVFPGQWYLLAATLSAGLAFSWLRQALSPDLSFDDLAHLADEAGSSEGLFFLPHLAGERTPYMDPGSKGAFWGLSLRHTRAHLARAAMEGVIFSLRACLDLMVGLGVPVETVVASGGGAGHPFWRRLMADIFDRPVVYRQVERGSAYGAALLAGVGVGLFGSMDAALQAARPVPEEITRPDPQRAAGYAQAYTTFRQLYPALRSVGRGD